MKHSYGGLIAEPQGVSIKDNSTGVFGFGRSTVTSTSLVADSIYDQIVPEIYTDSEMPVNCKVAAGRDESDFYEALGIVGEGPIIAYTPPHYEDLDGDGTAETFVGSTLDGQAHHGYPTNSFGLRQCLGTDPAGATDFFSLDQTGNSAGGDWRKAQSGASVYKDNFAAGTAFIVIRRSDAKGLQLSKPGDHAMVANIQAGMSGWVWTSPGTRVFGPPLTNPVWIAVNMLLRARGLRLGGSATTAQLDLAETFFDVQAALDAAAICDDSVTKMVGSGSEPQFKFRGVLQEEKPLRDWLQEVLMNCLGYYTFAFGRLKIGIRENSSTVEPFTIGNILFNSLQLSPLKPAFNHLTANFADQDYAFVNNSLTAYDIDYASQIGSGAGPLFLKSNVNLSGTFSKSQAARIISTRLREELGGTGAAEWKAAPPAVVPDHGPGAQHGTGDGLLDEPCGHAGWLGRVPCHRLEAQPGLLDRHPGAHHHGLDVRPRGWAEARRRRCVAGAGGDLPRHRRTRHRPGHAEAHGLRIVCGGRDRSPARRGWQREHHWRHRDRDGPVLRGRTRYRPVGTPRRRL